MYEFLAPWGLLGPAVSALIAYVFSNRARRDKKMKTIEVNRLSRLVPLETRVLSRCSD